MFYLTCRSLDERTSLIKFLASKGIKATFHYLSLHSSAYFTNRHDGRKLEHSDKWSNCLVRLPMYTDLKTIEVDYVCDQIKIFFNV